MIVDPGANLGGCRDGLGGVTDSPQRFPAEAWTSTRWLDENARDVPGLWSMGMSPKSPCPQVGGIPDRDKGSSEPPAGLGFPVASRRKVVLSRTDSKSDPTDFRYPRVLLTSIHEKNSWTFQRAHEKDRFAYWAWVGHTPVGGLRNLVEILGADANALAYGSFFIRANWLTLFW